jgi:hypothetical protein
MDPKLSLRMLQLLIGGIITGEVLPDVDEFFADIPTNDNTIEETWPTWSLLIRAYIGGGPSPANIDYCRDLLTG